MNCKPGDMAMVTREHWASDADGRPVPIKIFGVMVTVVATDDGTNWNIAEHIDIGPYTVTRIADSVLTPYRPWERSEADEMLRIAGLPQERVT